jgi:hypothetical protein
VRMPNAGCLIWKKRELFVYCVGETAPYEIIPISLLWEETSIARSRSDMLYQLDIRLADIEPPIWRQIIVSGNITLFRLHQIFQVVMGWEHAHLHGFQAGEKRYGEPDPDDDLFLKNDHQVRLRTIAREPGACFTYLYDFGDSWCHDVTVEQIESATETVYSHCFDGARAAPPEDCGGVGRYLHLLEVLRDRRHQEYQELRQWAGKHYDPDLFSLQAINSALAALIALDVAR